MFVLSYEFFRQFNVDYLSLRILLNVLCILPHHFLIYKIKHPRKLLLIHITILLNNITKTKFEK